MFCTLYPPHGTGTKVYSENNFCLPRFLGRRGKRCQKQLKGVTLKITEQHKPDGVDAMKVSGPPNSHGVVIQTEADSRKVDVAKFTIYFLLLIPCLLSLFVGHSFSGVLFRYVSLTFEVN
jgi:hypothetical protein